MEISIGKFKFSIGAAEIATITALIVGGGGLSAVETSL